MLEIRQGLQRWNQAEDVLRHGDDGEPEGGAAGRAEHRHGPAVQEVHLGHDPRILRRGSRRHPHHSRHGGGGRTVQQDWHHGWRRAKVSPVDQL